VCNTLRANYLTIYNNTNTPWGLTILLSTTTRIQLEGYLPYHLQQLEHTLRANYPTIYKNTNTAWGLPTLPSTTTRTHLEGYLSDYLQQLEHTLRVTYFTIYNNPNTFLRKLQVLPGSKLTTTVIDPEILGCPSLCFHHFYVLCSSVESVQLCYFGVSEWLLFNANTVILQLYRG
jgi:hypothetical protein